MRETSLGAREGDDESVGWVWVAAGGTQEVVSMRTVFSSLAQSLAWVVVREICQVAMKGSVATKFNYSSEYS